MKVSHNPELTSSELAVLWTSYQTDTMLRCVMKHFLSVCEDEAIKKIQQSALENTEKAIQMVTEIFSKEKIPLPVGFTEEDWNPNAKRLYSDLFTLHYMKHMARLGMAAASVAKSVCARKDVNEYFTVALRDASYLYDLAIELMLEKGVFVRPPMIAKPEKAEFIQDESFLSQLFGTHRPLNVVEMSHMNMNAETNLIGLELLLGFSQTAQLQEVRDFVWEGKEFTKSYIKLLSDQLLNDDKVQPSSSVGDVTESKEPPFSDKLMCFQTAALCSAGFGNYAASVSASQRTDLTSMYTRMMTETSQYCLKGAKLMIKHQWLEQPPQSKDRKTLSKQ